MAADDPLGFFDGADTDGDTFHFVAPPAAAFDPPTVPPIPALTPANWDHPAGLPQPLPDLTPANWDHPAGPPVTLPQLLPTAGAASETSAEQDAAAAAGFGPLVPPVLPPLAPVSLSLIHI